VNRAKILPRRIGLVRALGGISLAAIVVCMAGCEKEDPIRVYNAPKDAPPPMMTASDEPAVAPIEWKVPAGWEKQPPRQIIFAAFRISSQDAKTECTVTRLGTRPDLLLQNVNRWEGQLGLSKSQDSDLGSRVKEIDLPTGKAQLVELRSPTPAAGAATAPIVQQMVAVMLPHGPETWFLKSAARAT